MAQSGSSFQERVRAHGIVGAGGAGFPTYAKLGQTVETFIVNGAECEPLLHKDKELMRHYGEALAEGMAKIQGALQAREAVLAVKEKYEDVIASMKKRLPKGMRVRPLGDFYPAGDEQVIVHEVTGRVVPRGGLPLHVGAVVMNVETVLNIAWDQPVTHTYMTVAGAVPEPKSVKVPVGMSIREVIQACGGTNVEPFAVLSGGVMMGKLATRLDDPVTKTTGGLLVFPDDHPLITRYRRDYKAINRIGKSACDQCSFCTELCPRYLLGHPIEPHKAMRALEFSHDKLALVVGTHFCCECNLCSLIACPEDLDPKNVCVQNKIQLREQKIFYPKEIPDRPIHGMAEGRRTPVKRLFAKLGLNRFDNRGPLSDLMFDPVRVTIPLRQHAGAPAVASVQKGDRVRRGDSIGQVPRDQLGADVHASIDGVVESVSDTCVVIGKG